MNGFGYRFGGGVGVGFVGERVEVGDREVSLCERASLVKENSCCIPGILDGFNGLVSVKEKVE